MDIPIQGKRGESSIVCFEEIGSAEERIAEFLLELMGYKFLLG